MIVNISLFIIFILFSAFFSASETAFFSLSNIRLRRMQERYPRTEIIKDFLKRPTRLLSVIVFGNMLVNIALTSFSTAIFVTLYGKQGLILAIFLSGLMILFLGEIFPKMLAIHSAERFSLFSSYFLNFFSKALSPLILTIERLVDFFSKFFLSRKMKAAYSEEEFKTAVLLSRKGGEISAEEREMISYVLEFKDTHVGQILTARVDIEGIDAESSQREVIKTLNDKRHSKFPIYKDSLDNIVGILYAKDLFLQPDKDYHTLLREPIFVPESKGIDDLLKLLLEKQERIAIVLDEYGGCAGLVTLEDIEEEIFGEIYDEFEIAKELIEKIDEKTFRVLGKTPIKTVNIELDLDLPEEEDTLAGFLLSRKEEIPRPNESFRFKNTEFTIERATAKRIVSVVLKKN